MVTLSSAPGHSTATMNHKRPPEVEGWLNLHIYHPLSRRLANALKSTFVTPNMVSVLGFLFICAAAFAYTGLAWPVSALLGFLLHISWHVIDGADGELARMTGKASATGELVDGLCDYAGHIVLYIALAAMLDDTIGGWSWFIASCAGASHIVQSNHTETQRRIYRWWAYGTGWIGQARKEGDEVFSRRSGISLLFGWAVYPYLWLGRIMNPSSAEVEAALAEAANNPALLERMRRIVRDEAKVAVLYQHIVGPNPRAIILGASMALGSPLWFFLATVGPQNLLLAISIYHHHAMNRRLAARLKAELAAARA